MFDGSFADAAKEIAILTVKGQTAASATAADILTVKGGDQVNAKAAAVTIVGTLSSGNKQPEQEIYRRWGLCLAEKLIALALLLAIGSGAATVTSLNAQSGGITNAGAVSGVTTLTASSSLSSGKRHPEQRYMNVLVPPFALSLSLLAFILIRTFLCM